MRSTTVKEAPAVSVGHGLKAGSLIGVFFFFQAEDGIRDYKVTGVQTCALPIFLVAGPAAGAAGTPPAAPSGAGAVVIVAGAIAVAGRTRGSRLTRGSRPVGG